MNMKLLKYVDPDPTLSNWILLDKRVNEKIASDEECRRFYIDEIVIKLDEGTVRETSASSKYPGYRIYIPECGKVRWVFGEILNYFEEI